MASRQAPIVQNKYFMLLQRHDIRFRRDGLLFSTPSDWPKIALIEGTVVSFGFRFLNEICAAKPTHDRRIPFAVKGHITMQKQVCSIVGL